MSNFHVQQNLFKEIVESILKLIDEILIKEEYALICMSFNIAKSKI